MKPPLLDRLEKLCLLSTILCRRWIVSKVKQDLDWSIAIRRLALDFDRPGRFLHRCNILSAVAYSRFIRHVLWEETPDLDRAIHHWRAALRHCPEDEEVRVDILVKLEDALRDRYGHYKTLEDLSEIIEVERTILDALSKERSFEHGLVNIGHDPYERLGEYGLAKDLSGVTRVLRGTSGRPSVRLPHRYLLLYALGNALHQRYNETENGEDLGEAIQVTRDALALLPDPHPDRHLMLHTFCHASLIQLDREGDAIDLNEFIRSCRDALRLDVCPEDCPRKHQEYHFLGPALSDRFERSGSEEDLDESIMIFRSVRDKLSITDPLYAPATQDLGVLLRNRFTRSGHTEDLEESIRLHREAIRLLSERKPFRAAALINLSNGLLVRFDYHGVEEDLSESIRLQREALTLLPYQDRRYSLALSTLADALQRRFVYSAREEDLNEAIELYRVSLGLPDNGNSERCLRLDSFACALLERFDLGGRMQDLDMSIVLTKDALSRYPNGAPNQPTFHINLANALRRRFEECGNMEDLSNSIQSGREALALCSVGHPDRPLALMNLSASLACRVRWCRRLEDADDAEKLLRECLDLLPPGHPERCKIMFNISGSLYARYEEKGYAEDYEGCISYMDQAAGYTFSSTQYRLRAATTWARIARLHNHSSTITAYRATISLLLRAFTYGPSLHSRLDLLRRDVQYTMCGVDAASYAIEKGELGTAIELLEQGRALLWSQMRGLRTPLYQLAGVTKTLADRFKAVTRDLEALITSSESRIAFGPVSRSVDGMMERMRQLSQEQEHLINEIRNIPGFEHFLQAATFDELQRAAAEGPVIVINHSVFRCDALIVLPRKDDPCICIPLDKEWLIEACSLCDKLVEARSGPGPQSMAYDEVLREVTKVLWDRVVSKVVQKLGELKIPQGSRVWWCPTSCLTLLPFHAAGPSQGDDGGKYFLDYYTSSYTPTLMSLIIARANVRSSPQKMLFVGDGKLPSTTREYYAIRKHMRIEKCILNGHASPDAVLKALRKAGWVHFACHGTINYERPFESSLALPGGNLTLLDIAKARLPDAEFAFLSACHTAESSSASAHDEALHLAAAVQFCGFRSVVGTMWQLLDRDGPILAECVYAHLANDIEDERLRFKGAAAAVRKAALFLRSQKDWTDDGRAVGIALERWVNLVHIGA